MENLVAIAKRRDIFQCCWNFDSKVDFVQQNMDNSDLDPELFNNCESLFIGVVEDEENYSSEIEWTIDLLVNQTLLSFKIYSDAQANIAPPKLF